MDDDENYDPDELDGILSAFDGEREIAQFIKRNPRTLYWSLCNASGHDRYVFHEFPIGNRYKADFLVLNSYSGAWEAYFIEFEPVRDTVFIKSGEPSRRLRGAIKQVDDWAAYIEDNFDTVRKDLVRWAKTKDLLKYSTREEPCNYSRNFLKDPDTFVHKKYQIYIGRREDLTAEQHGNKARYSDRHSVEISSYDRLLDLAKLRYGDKS